MDCNTSRNYEIGQGNEWEKLGQLRHELTVCSRLLIVFNAIIIVEDWRYLLAVKENNKTHES